MNTQLLDSPVRSDRRPDQRPRAARPATACRFVSLLLNQHTGLPFFLELSPEHENILPAEQALWGVGVRGWTVGAGSSAGGGDQACSAATAPMMPMTAFRTTQPA